MTRTPENAHTPEQFPQLNAQQLKFAAKAGEALASLLGVSVEEVGTLPLADDGTPRIGYLGKDELPRLKEGKLTVKVSRKYGFHTIHSYGQNKEPSVAIPRSF